MLSSSQTGIQKEDVGNQIWIERTFKSDGSYCRLAGILDLGTTANLSSQLWGIVLLVVMGMNPLLVQGTNLCIHTIDASN